MANTAKSQTEAGCAGARSLCSASLGSFSTQPVPEEHFTYRRGDITPFCPVSIEIYAAGNHLAEKNDLGKNLQQASWDNECRAETQARAIFSTADSRKYGLRTHAKGNPASPRV